MLMDCDFPCLLAGCGARRFGGADVQWVANEIIRSRVQTQGREPFRIARQQRSECREYVNSGVAETLYSRETLGDWLAVRLVQFADSFVISGDGEADAQANPIRKL